MTAFAVPGRFEGSYLGDASRISATARMECKICWHVYDPAEGCELWQVPAGTAFAALPDDWRCPVCDGARDQFMTLDVGADPAPDTPARPVAIPPAAPPGLPVETIRRLERAFREIHTAQMRGVPIVNDALAVKAVGFRAWEGRWLGALVTPWFLNLVLLPGAEDDWSGLIPGAKELVEFPSGRYEYVHALRKDVGPYKACSLFSPMFEFTTMLHATETASAALVALFDPANREDGTRSAEIRRLREAELAPPPEAVETVEPAPAPEPPRPSRRALLLGMGATERDAPDA
ncbi:[NiFe]-hydrogenase assembly chaperone HybE [Azospirillum doebereinerae]|uniref:[NiFe]-hydrogenase assembly, chaperone, HybE n=1 Tax=Azospirillum doebereinerae TaxID=92933 RepID=A0A433J992_9PROT|nr:[NiFe]-hydrogenase assembly chaperone HybE [Azospirillum doebereinerae]RUQ71379.1 [NiFe]-hydrogenase assembly, chaperone, HybE [Azospirillum doebereinerae]